jgi:hypothetical protein
MIDGSGENKGWATKETVERTLNQRHVRNERSDHGQHYLFNVKKRYSIFGFHNDDILYREI